MTITKKTLVAVQVSNPSGNGISYRSRSGDFQIPACCENHTIEVPEALKDAITADLMLRHPYLVINGQKPVASQSEHDDAAEPEPEPEEKAKPKSTGTRAQKAAANKTATK